MDYEIAFLKALLLTISIETVVLYILLKFVFKKPKVLNRVILIAGITASFATLPYLWFIYPLFLRTRLTYIIVSELTAVLLESFILLGFLRVNYIRALILSFICNATSFFIGLMINL